MFNPGPKVISPSQSTTFTAPHQSYIHTNFNIKLDAYDAFTYSLHNKKFK
jgi:hypothetical protein